MQYLLLIFILLGIGCSQEKANKKKPIADSVNLFNQNISPDPLIIEPPSIVSTPFNINDSSAFYIQLMDSAFEVKISLKGITILTDMEDLDQIISKYKADIDSTKIFVNLNDVHNSERVKALSSILKKHKYFKFKLIASN